VAHYSDWLPFSCCQPGGRMFSFWNLLHWLCRRPQRAMPCRRRCGLDVPSPRPTIPRANAVVGPIGHRISPPVDSLLAPHWPPWWRKQLGPPNVAKFVQVC
jgi:hypothetical protein